MRPGEVEGSRALFEVLGEVLVHLEHGHAVLAEHGLELLVGQALVRNSGGGRRVGRWTRFQAMRCDTGIPSRVIRFSTAQPTRASVFWAGRVRARRPRPMRAL